MPPSHSTKALEEERDVLFGIINRFIGYFTRDSQRESQNDPEAEYPFVPMDTRQMYEQIRFVRNFLAAASEKREQTFLDIGCGIGNVLLVAELFDFSVAGFEKDPYPCAIARKLIGEDRVTEEDIWDYDNYGFFDVIYYFRPFHHGMTQRRFERFIEDQLKPGGILIANRKMSDDIEKDPRFQRLNAALPIWQKRILSGEEVNGHTSKGVALKARSTRQKSMNR